MTEITLNVEVADVAGWMCEDCEESFEYAPESPLYECAECGVRFTHEGSADGDSHRCPECNKFAAKIADFGCPQCGDGEVEPFDGHQCPGCDEVFINISDLMEHW